MYHLSSGLLETVRGKNDNTNSIISGAVAGLAFKSTSGIKAAALATLLGGAGVATYHIVDDLLNGREISLSLS